MVDDKTLKSEVFQYLEGKDLSSLSRRELRTALEKSLGLPKGSLDAEKDKINEFVSQFLSEHEPEEESEEESEEDEKPKAAGKRKRDASAEDDGDAKKPVLTVVTKSGKTAPKNVAKAQANAMKGSKFEAEAQDLVLDVFGNTVTGQARTFTSGNRGWYAGGKIEVTVGTKKLWAQVGCNITILGSKEWS